jgi:serine/threonine protein kinase
MGTIGGGRYELGAPIASGAIGVVVRAVDTGTGEPVAVKRLRPETAGHPESVLGFLAEAEILAQLRHPAIVRLRDLLSEPDGYALVLDLVPGADLRRRVREGGPLAPALAVQIVATVADALGYLHGRGFLHGDIKPGNVVLPDDGTAVRLVDFGVSRRIGQTDRATYATPEYVAPEVVLGQVPGTAADVYALGMVLFELCCGRSAFRGGTADEVLNRHLTCAPVPPPGLAESIWPVISDCLATHPGHRPPAAALPARLHALVPALSGLAAPEPLAPDAVTWWPREADETAPILGLRRVAWVPATRQNPDPAALERMVAVPMPDAPMPDAAADRSAEPPTSVPPAPPVPIWPTSLAPLPVSPPAGPFPPSAAPEWPAPATVTGSPDGPSYATPVPSPTGSGHPMAPGRAAVPAAVPPPSWQTESPAGTPPKSRLPLLLGVGAAVLVVLGLIVLGGFLLRGQFTGDSPAAKPSPSPSVAATAAQPSGSASAPAPQPTASAPSPGPQPSASPKPGGSRTPGNPNPQPTGTPANPAVPSIGASLPGFP